MRIFLFRPIALPADSCLGGISSWQDKKEQGPACPVAGGVSGNVASPISPRTTGDHWRPLATTGDHWRPLAVQEASILALNFLRNVPPTPNIFASSSCFLPAPRPAPSPPRRHPIPPADPSWQPRREEGGRLHRVRRPHLLPLRSRRCAGGRSGQGDAGVQGRGSCQEGAGAGAAQVCAADGHAAGQTGGLLLAEPSGVR